MRTLSQKSKQMSIVRMVPLSSTVVL